MGTLLNHQFNILVNQNISGEAVTQSTAPHREMLIKITIVLDILSEVRVNLPSVMPHATGDAAGFTGESSDEEYEASTTDEEVVIFDPAVHAPYLANYLNAGNFEYFNLMLLSRSLQKFASLLACFYSPTLHKKMTRKTLLSQMN